MELFKIFIKIMTFLIISGIVLYAYARLEKSYVRFSAMRRLMPSNKKEEQRLAKLSRTQLEKFFISLGLTALPSEKQELDKVEILLRYAGYRSLNATVIYFGLRIFSALVLTAIYIFWIIISGSIDLQGMILVFFPLAAGYYLPPVFLKRKVAHRHLCIFRELPDTIDLILICMDAGISFDMALFRVSKELSKLAPVLSGEFNQYFFEIKSGLSRKQALKNLGERNGERSLLSVLQVILQSLKFGTDIAEALRRYATALRKERIRIAEEKGGKISIKLTFVTILLIMPAYLLIVLGPMIIRLKDIF